MLMCPSHSRWISSHESSILYNFPKVIHWQIRQPVEGKTLRRKSMTHENESDSHQGFSFMFLWVLVCLVDITVKYPRFNYVRRHRTRAQLRDWSPHDKLFDNFIYSHKVSLIRHTRDDFWFRNEDMSRLSELDNDRIATFRARFRSSGPATGIVLLLTVPTVAEVTGNRPSI